MLLNQGLTNHVYSWSHVFSELVFTKDECQQIIDLCGKTLKVKPSVNFASNLIDVRKSKNDFLFPTKENSWIFEKINYFVEHVNLSYFRMNLIGYEYIQYAEYHSQTQDKYDWHTDLIFGDKSKDTKYLPDVCLTRKLSLSILLSDETGFEGGNFELNTDGEHRANKINMKQGSVIVFPSYIFHRVTPMIKGTRKSLVVWVVGDNFV